MKRSEIVPDLTIEGYFTGQVIAGIDEVGRGPLAGPLVVAAVIISDPRVTNFKIAGIRDSKTLSANQRSKLYQQITATYEYAIDIASVAEIEALNISQATKLACLRVVEKLKTKPNVVIVDGNMKFADHRFHSFIRGDQRSISIAAASIVAKVYRDALMAKLATNYPLYGWQNNKGYPTSQHKSAILNYGITPWHRKTYKLPLSTERCSKGVQDL